MSRHYGPFCFASHRFISDKRARQYELAEAFRQPSMSLQTPPSRRKHSRQLRPNPQSRSAGQLSKPERMDIRASSYTLVAQPHARSLNPPRIREAADSRTLPYTVSCRSPISQTTGPNLERANVHLCPPGPQPDHATAGSAELWSALGRVRPSISRRTRFPDASARQPDTFHGPVASGVLAHRELISRFKAHT